MKRGRPSPTFAHAQECMEEAHAVTMYDQEGDEQRLPLIHRLVMRDGVVDGLERRILDLELADATDTRTTMSYLHFGCGSIEQHGKDLRTAKAASEETAFTHTATA